MTVTAGNVCDRDAIDDLLAPVARDTVKPVVFGDSAYADGNTLARLEGQGFEVVARVPPAVNRKGRYSKDDFTLDLDAETVSCPAGHVVAIRWADAGAARPASASCAPPAPGVGVHHGGGRAQRRCPSP